MLNVISLALLSSFRLKFPMDKSIACILWSGYGNTVVKDIRKFEKIDFVLQKCKLDLLFLVFRTLHRKPSNTILSKLPR